MCRVFLVFPAWCVTPLSCHWAHWSEGWLCKEWINLCNWEYLYQQPLASHQLNKVTTGKKVGHAQATGPGIKMTQDLIHKVLFWDKALWRKISWKNLLKNTPITLYSWCCDNPWVMRWEHTEAVITNTGLMSVKHHQSKKSRGVNAQCGATLKWFKISSSSFSCKCGPQAWAEIKPHWNLCWALLGDSSSLNSHRYNLTTLSTSHCFVFVYC